MLTEVESGEAKDTTNPPETDAKGISEAATVDDGSAPVPSTDAVPPEVPSTETKPEEAVPADAVPDLIQLDEPEVASKESETKVAEKQIPAIPDVSFEEGSSSRRSCHRKQSPKRRRRRRRL